MLQPGAPSPPPHFHPRQTEKWHVIEGTPSVQDRRELGELAAGESVTDAAWPVPRCATVPMVSSASVTCMSRAGDFQEYIETLHHLSAGKAQGAAEPA